MNKQVALEQLDRRAETLFSIGDAVWDHLRPTTPRSSPPPS